LLSNAGRKYLDPVFEKAEIDDLFDCMIVSSDVGLVKPDTKIYVLALSGLDVNPEEAVMIYDRIHNVNGAIHATKQMVLFCTVTNLAYSNNILLLSWRKLEYNQLLADRFWPGTDHDDQHQDLQKALFQAS